MAQAVSTLTLQWSREETADVKLLSFRPSRPWEFVPGAVAVLGMEGQGEAYFSIASPPEMKASLEFLVKRGKGVSQALLAAPAGSTVNAKGPVGKGFPINSFKGDDLLMVAAGVAVAPLRSVAMSVLRRRNDFARVVLVYGVRKPEDFCLLSEIAGWRQADIQVVQVISRPDGTHWHGKTGHVQDHLSQAMQGMERPVALVCGMNQMIEETKHGLAGLGLIQDRVLTNF